MIDVIVDWFYPNNAMEDDPLIYVRTRGADGVLHERIIGPDDDDYMTPFCWVPSNLPERTQSRIVRRYPGTVFHPSERAEGIDGTSLMKLSTPKPGNLWDIKDELNSTYEADLNFNDCFIIQNYPEGIPEFHPRIWYFDLEWDPREDFTTVMAVVDNQDEFPHVFAWKDGRAPKDVWVDREGGYMLHLCEDEHSTHDAFLNYLEDRNPDILVAHASNWADIPHMMRRMEDPARLSPINQIIRPRGNDGYDDTAQPIKGRIVYDSAARGMTGSGFESIWQKSGRGQMSSRKLDWVAQKLELGEKLTNRVEGMTVHNGWYDYFDEFVDYCLVDTTLLRDVDQKLHATEFHVAMMKLCGVNFGSTFRVTRYFRGLIARRTHYKAPSSRAQSREDLQAAYIPDPVAGRHEGVALVDYASLYPNIIRSLNLSWETKMKNAGDNIKSPGNNTHWDQSRKGLLPSVVEEMLALRKEYKRKMYEATDDNERLGFDMLQTATKVAVNALYGMVSMNKIGGMWSDLDIGRTITYMGRESIKFLLAESEKMGYRGLYGHTDSAFIQVPFEEAENLAKHLTTQAQEQLDMPFMDVELEAYFDYWMTASTKNRYFGIKTWPESDKGKMKISGFEIKAANSAPISKRVQETAMQLVGMGADEDEVNDAIRPISLAVKNGEIPIEELSPYGRIKNKFAKYKANVPLPVRAAKYYNDNLDPDEPFKPGDGAQWVFVKAVPEGMSNTVRVAHKTFDANVIAFRETSELDDFTLDYDTIVEKMIRAKLKNIYETMGWSLDTASGAPVPEVYW